MQPNEVPKFLSPMPQGKLTGSARLGRAGLIQGQGAVLLRSSPSRESLGSLGTRVHYSNFGDQRASIQQLQKSDPGQVDPGACVRTLSLCKGSATHARNTEAAGNSPLILRNSAAKFNWQNLSTPSRPQTLK